MYANKPIIGLTSSYEKTAEHDRVFVNHSYLDAIRHFGGIPVILPTEGNIEEFEALVNICDGILLTGGDDIEPWRFGEEVLNSTVELTPIRDEREWMILDLAVKRDLPLLGICRGIQTLNVYFGGSLYQDIPAQLPESAIRHSMEPPYHRACHTVYLEPDSPLANIVGCTEIGTNSHHHQSVKDAAPGFAVMGRTEDGVIEAICDPDKAFVWGVQWHPERIWDIEDSSARVFEAFVSACAKK